MKILRAVVNFETSTTDVVFQDACTSEALAPFNREMTVSGLGLDWLGAADATAALVAAVANAVAAIAAQQLAAPAPSGAALTFALPAKQTGPALVS